MNKQCEFHNSRGSRCPLPAVWRLQLSKGDPFTLVFCCTHHVEHWPWVEAVRIAVMGPEPAKLEKEGSD